MEFALEIKKIMASQNYTLAVRDNFQRLLMKPILNLTERRISQEPVDVFIKNRVFGTIVECVQNICRSENSVVKKDAILLLSRSNDFYIINAGKVINGVDKEKWSEWLLKWSKEDLINLKSELVDLKKNKGILDRNLFEKMAILELFLKSKGLVGFSFHPMVSENYLFELEIKIALN